MSLSTQQLQTLDALPTPASLDRIIRFLSDLGAQGNMPLGETGRSAQAFAAARAGMGAQSFSARQASDWVAILMDRYQIKIGEIQEFALWFVQRQEILSKTSDLIERTPDLALARLPAPDALPGASFPDSAQRPASSTPPTTLRRTPDAAPARPMEAALLRESPSATAEDRTSLRQAGRDSRPPRTGPRLHRIERGPATPEEAEQAEPATPSDDPAPFRRPFRLTPKMVARPAFVADVGLAGMLLGLNVGSISASPADVPSIALAAPTLQSFGPSPEQSPTYPANLPRFSPSTPAFAPNVTPLSLPAPVWLGMPPVGPAVAEAPATPPPAFALPVVQPLPGTMLPDAWPQALDILPGVPAETLIDRLEASSLPGGISPPNGSSVRSLLLLTGMAAGSAALVAAQHVGASPPLLMLASPAMTAWAGAFQAQNGLLSLNAPSQPQALFLGSAAVPAMTERRTAEEIGQDIVGGAPAAVVTPEMGQLTLLAPPLQVSSAQAEQRGIAASVDWATLAAGMGSLDEGALVHLKRALPDQASILYPSLPSSSLGSGAVNLPLSAPLIQSLLQKGYGNASLGTATQAARLGASVAGGKPPAAPLSAQLVPTRRPAGAAPGIMGHAAETQGGAGALGEAGKGQATRGGVMDFLGLPVRLAPRLGGRADLAHETAVRNAGLGQPPQILRPEQFAPLRNRLFSTFPSIVVEPDKAAWQKAAPAFGLRDGKATTLLSPDARLPVQTPTSPQPASRSRPSLSSPAAHAPGGPLAPALLGIGQKPTALPGYPGATPHAASPNALAVSPHAETLGHVPNRGTPVAFGPAALHAALPLLQGPTGLGAGTVAPAFVPSLSDLIPGRRPLAHPSLSFPAPHLPSALGHSSPGSGHSFSTFSPLPVHSAYLLGQRVMPLSSQAGIHWTTPSGPPRSLLAPVRLSSGINIPARADTDLHPRLSFGAHSSALRGSSPAFRAFASPGMLASPVTHSARSFPSAAAAPAFSHGGGGSRVDHAGGVNLLAAALPQQVVLALPQHKVAPLHLPVSRLVQTPAATLSLSRLFAPHSPLGVRRTGARLTGGFEGAAPAMRLAPRASHHPATGTTNGPALAVQRSTYSPLATPAQNQNTPAHSPVAAGPSGAASGEVNAMASEVWSLLKRRLATEAERRGRW